MLVREQSSKAEDVSVVQANKGADFRTVQEMIRDLSQRISDAFLILNVRQSERTTATEVVRFRWCLIANSLASTAP